jgi:hypothetical protein
LQAFRYQLKDAIEEKLPHIPSPMLVVRGQHDPIWLLPWAVEMARRLPQDRLVEIPAVARTLVYAAPEQLAQVPGSSWTRQMPPGPKRQIRPSGARARPRLTRVSRGGDADDQGQRPLGAGPNHGR